MRCPSCNKTRDPDDKFCMYCGHSFLENKINDSTTEKKVTKGGNELSDTRFSNNFLVVNNNKSQRRQYGEFWPRAGAYVVDLSLILIGLVLIILFFGPWTENLDTIVGIASLIVYHTFFLSYSSTTPGKKLFGLRVVTKEGEHGLTLGRALGRSVSYIVSWAVIGFGFWQIAFDKNEHRGWHDNFAGTVVVGGNYNKKRAIVIAVVAAVFYLAMIFYGYGAEEEFSPYPIRTGTREIQNQLSLNPQLFDGQIGTQSPDEGVSDFSGIGFDIKRALAAVVSVNCPIDNTDNWNVGSGVIVGEGGIILTNYHVIQDTTQYYCTIGITNNLSEEPEYRYYADYVLTDSVSSEEFTVINEVLDIAFLQIIDAEAGFQFPTTFPIVTMGGSDELNVNDKIYIAGYPAFGGETITLTEGVMSGRLGDDLIKTSAKIDSGNSGGAAFNERGELIGIPTLLAEGTLEGLGYIVGIDSVIYWIEQLVQ